MDARNQPCVQVITDVETLTLSGPTLRHLQVRRTEPVFHSLAQARARARLIGSGRMPEP